MRSMAEFVERAAVFFDRGISGEPSFYSHYKPACRFVSSAIAGAMLGVAQSPHPHWVLATFALTPWVIASRSAISFREAAVHALIFVLAYGSVVISWVPSAWTNLGLTPMLAPLATAACSVFTTFPVYFLAGIATWLTRALNDRCSIAIPGISLALAEHFLGAWALGVPWAHIAHTQVDSGISQLAAVGGVPLITLLVVSVNVALALVLERPTVGRVRLALAIIAAMGALAAFGQAIAHLSWAEVPELPSIRVLIAQPDTARGERWNPDLQTLNFERFLSVIHRAIREQGHSFDVVVGPENLITSRIDKEKSLWDGVVAEVDSIGHPMIFGAVRGSPDLTDHRYRSSVVWLAPGRGIVAVTDKERAVPIVESEPQTWLERQLAAGLGMDPSATYVETVRGGTDLRDRFSVTPVVCWEALFAELVARRRGVDSQFILNLADDSWVEGNSATDQLADFARFRAIEQRLPLIRVAHGGLSVHVDRYGQVLEVLPIDQYAYSIVEIPPSSPVTVFEKASLAALPFLAGLGVWSSWSVLIRLFCSSRG